MGTALPKRIPLFPLPTTVLFPEIPLPLHIFEPRYRAMTTAALAGSNVIGMALLKPGFEKEYEGRPAIYDVGCAGIILRHEKLPDGRFNIMLMGARRFRIVAELSGDPYRLADVEYLPEQRESTQETANQRAALMEHLRYLSRRDNPEAFTPPEPPEGISDYEFVNFVSHVMDISPLEKQALLEEHGVESRYRKLNDILAFWRLGRERGMGPSQ